VIKSRLSTSSRSIHNSHRISKVVESQNLSKVLVSPRLSNSASTESLPESSSIMKIDMPRVRARANTAFSTRTGPFSPKRSIRKLSPKIDRLTHIQNEVECIFTHTKEWIKKAELKIKQDAEFSELMTIQTEGIHNVIASLVEKAPSEKKQIGPSKFATRAIDCFNRLDHTFIPVVQSSAKFAVSPSTQKFVEPYLHVIEDIYEEQFYPNSHYNYIGIKKWRMWFCYKCTSTSSTKCT